MNLTDLQRRNEKLQEAAARLNELLPGKNLLPLTTIIIRSSRRIDGIFPSLLSVKSEDKFNSIMERLEEEMDEVIYALDMLHDFNRRQKIVPVDDFIKYGYDLLSVYSFACDKIIERRISEEA